MPPELLRQIRKAVKDNSSRWDSISDFVRGNAYRQLAEIGIVPKEKEADQEKDDAHCE